MVKERSSDAAVIIGLDGTPYSFLKHEIDKGTLPALAGLFGNGLFSRMETEIPAISSVAWTSFMTGVNPGMHGIYGFTDRKPGTYELYFPNYSHLKADALWDKLSAKGKRCCVVNVPSTYPAHELNGILVSGFVAPNLERAVYPREAYEYLVKVGYSIDVDASKGRESLDLLLEDLHATLEKRREAMHHFWRQEDWDLFACVFTGTDRLHHFLWRHYEDGDRVYAAEFIRYYQRLDEIIGEFSAELPGDINLFMLSDHGFCSIESEVYLNTFLSERGFLEYRNDRPRTIADIEPLHTRAFCMDPGRIYINLEGREPQGIVHPGEEYDKLCSDLEDQLMQITEPETGRNVIKEVIPGSKLYEGPQLDVAPDLVAVPVRGADLKGSTARAELFFKGHLTGMHTHDDAFAFVRTESEVRPINHIRQLAPLIEGVVDS